ncbi:Exodeoxyribonuclease VII large subunit [Austwickia chelonae]|uniref:Exodeoxyribonuclease 7 large subunit n=1 Tax=Austwickia chelonae NBRC 105200 TaxID=1184607 RepID=K6W8J7_9MICO|nr:exodeoxyribonuclease VII large subunit [Austwickia chelonae]GAB78142.1 exodeoxyribonuclease VII large subunit [Austwickia chelonae NBRC 105200]SEV97499.1 Exodeoxyribonuclease VII large subunit [Austwickia chelonae]
MPEKAASTTVDDPWPVRLLSTKITEYVGRMSPLWVEGQVVQFNRRSGRLCFLTLRDPEVDMSLTVTLPGSVVDALPSPLTSGSRVVVHARPTFWAKRGTLQLEGKQIQPIGEGDLLARIEQLKRSLAAEGLFAAHRKRPLPFLPRTVGLICGRASAAEQDVLENARRRWPAVHFQIREVPVQGIDAVPAVRGALRELDDDEQVDVIVIARGGGSFEDLLPFSSEALVRAVAAARTPVVSAIGHDVDTPLLDFVADLRASTPTDAAKRIVPDVAEERAGLTTVRVRLGQAISTRLSGERRHLEGLRSRPVLADPASMLAPYRQETAALRSRMRLCLTARFHREKDSVHHLRARVRTLSPLSTLQRGYAVVERPRGGLLSHSTQLAPKESVRVKMVDGSFDAQILTVIPAPRHAPAECPDTSSSTATGVG